MHTAAIIERNAPASPLGSARLAGVLYLFSVVSALAGEFLVGGQRGAAAGLVAVACYVAVTLLLYRVFLPTSQTYPARTFPCQRFDAALAGSSA